MTAEDAERLVIGPMTATFPAPHHLRGSRQAAALALDVYRRALSGFSPQALEKGWQKVAEESTIWCWPKCGDVVAACRSFEPRKHPTPDDWAERVERLAWAFTKRYMKTSAAAARAKEGGYEPQLRAYVRAAASVVAQYILNSDGIAYDGATLFQHCPGDRERHEAFFEKCRQQARSGQVKVTVPHALVRRWQQEHQEDRSR